MEIASRWDILFEHLERAEGAYSRRVWALDGTTYTPALLAQRVERELFANLDALLVAGATTKPFLQSVLIEDEDGSVSRRACAGMALIGLGDQDELVGLLSSDNPEVAEAALQALVHCGDARFDTWLRHESGRQVSSTPRKVLLRGALERNVEVGNLLVPLQSSDDEEVALAAELAQLADSGLHRPLVEYLTEHSSPSVRGSAMMTGLMFGSGRAFRACLAAAEDRERPNGLAMLLAALTGGASASQILCEHLGRPSHADYAALALGVCGQPEAAGTLLQYLDHGRPLTAKLAGEAFATITGLDLRDGSFNRPEPDDEEEDDEEPDPILMPRGFGSLPMPNRDPVVAWWQQIGRDRVSASSLLDGREWTPEVTLDFLQHAPLRRRHAVALWLSIHSGGAVRVNTRRFTRVQRAQMTRVATLPQRVRARNFHRMA